MSLLDGKVAVVTGGARGIGRASAIRLAAEGAHVGVLDLHAPKAAEVVQEIEAAGGQAIAIACDVSKSDQVQSAVEAVVARFGRLDIVFANAGINGTWAPLEQLETAEWDQTLAVNLRGTFLTLKHTIPHLKRGGGGSIIVTSSINGTRVFTTPGASAYSASKAAQVALAKQAALEVGRHNIRVNVICPGWTITDIGESTIKRGVEPLRANIPRYPDGSPALHGGRAQPSDIADVCVMLASDLSRHVSGTVVYADGGESLAR